MNSRRIGIAAAFAAVIGIAAYFTYETVEAPGNQVFGSTVVSGPIDAKVVALTYDDGPNPPYTDKILDVLHGEHVRATFFVVGRAAEEYPKVVRREIADGNAVGNHSWDHAHLVVLTRAQIRSSLKRTDDAIFRAAGVRPRIMRPPFGARDWLVLDEARKLGYTPVMWSVPLARDWEDPAPPVIAARVLKYVKDGAIIVLHDGNRGMICAHGHVPAHQCDRSSDIGATRLIVGSLKAQGYRFVTIPELIALRGTMHTSSHASE